MLSKKFYKIFRMAMWTIFLRDNNSGDDLKNIDILDEKKYLKFFKFKSNNFLKKKNLIVFLMFLIMKKYRLYC